MADHDRNGQQAATTPSPLAAPLALPCGTVIPNRLAKAAMSEQLASRSAGPDLRLERLYRRWADGGAGLLITGNVMVDGRSLGEPGNVVVEDDRHAVDLRRWAFAARSGGAVALAQVNHPGRQTMVGLSREVVAPSAIAAQGGPWAQPRALTEPEIHALIERFATTARVVVDAGFDGVQIHAAHGYLIGQFLSPACNQRTDDWGGDATGRMRFLLEIVRATRAAIGPERPIAVKLNSADFQRGGFEEDDSLTTVIALEREAIDLLEISGGTYEAPAMIGEQSGSTAAREAYFLAFAEQVRTVSDLPLMVTGGFRTGTAMVAALERGATDLVGLARPLALEPDLPLALLADPESTRSAFALPRLRPAILNAMAEFGWSQHQLRRLGAGQEPNASLDPRRAALEGLLGNGLGALRRRRRGFRMEASA